MVRKRGNLYSQSSRTSKKLGGFARENPQLTSSPETELFSQSGIKMALRG